MVPDNKKVDKELTGEEKKVESDLSNAYREISSYAELAKKLDGQLIAINEKVSTIWEDPISGIRLSLLDRDSENPDGVRTFKFDLKKFEKDKKSYVVILRSLLHPTQPSLKIVNKDGEDISQTIIPSYPHIKVKRFISIEGGNELITETSARKRILKVFKESPSLSEIVHYVNQATNIEHLQLMTTVLEEDVKNILDEETVKRISSKIKQRITALTLNKV